MPMTTRVMLRNSERSDFNDCRWRWDLSYNQRLRPVTVGMNPLVFGDIVHRGLAAWYIPEKSRKKVVRGVRPDITVEKIFDLLEAQGRSGKVPVYDGDDTAWTEAKELAIGMMQGYLRHYGNDDHYQVIYPEMPFQLDIYDADGRYVCTLVGTSDCLVRHRSSGKLMLLEHKTAAQISTGHLFADEQANTYWCIVPMWLRENGIIEGTEDIHGIEYNFLRKAIIKDDRPMDAQGRYLNQPTVAALTAALEAKGVQFKKTGMKKEDYIDLCVNSGIQWEQLGEVSMTQPDNLFHREMVFRNEAQRQKTFIRIMQQVREMKLVRSGQLDIYKNPSKSCSWCQYRDLCEMDELGGDTSAFVKTSFHHWNPYRDHIWSLDLAA